MQHADCQPRRPIGSRPRRAAVWALLALAVVLGAAGLVFDGLLVPGLALTTAIIAAVAAGRSWDRTRGGTSAATPNDRHTRETRLQLAVNAANLGLWDWDLRTDKFYFNDTYYRMLGYEPGELVINGDSWSAVCHPDDLPEELAALDQHFKGETPQYINEHRVRCKDDSWLWVRDAGEVVERDEHGSPTRMVGIHTDINVSKTLSRAHELLAALDGSGPLEETMTAASHALADVVGADFVCVSRVKTDASDRAQGTVIGGWHRGAPADPLQYDLDDTPCNEAVENDFCVYLDDVLSQFPEDDDLRAINARAYHGLKLLARDGSTLGVLVVVHTRPVSENQVIEGPMRLFGARVASEIERAEAEERIRQANEAKSEFLANMSHEIRTPMTAILGYGDLLADESLAAGGSERARDAARIIRSNAEHLLSLINDTLDVSKIEAGRMSIERVPTNPAEVIEQAAASLRSSASNQGLEFRVRIPDDLPDVIQTDPTKLRQILINLIGNAVKFTERGFVEIRASHNGETNQIRVEIEDTGIGMTPGQLERVARFETFTQADYSTTRRFGGTGLGLAISNKLANMLDGGLEVRSEAGRGTTFTLIINAPDRLQTAAAHGGAAGSPAAPDAGPREPLADLRILLAEDSVDNQRLIQFHLERRGAEVTCVADGLAALKAVLGDQRGFDVVLLDMQMPKLDGYDAARGLRNAGVDRPIIALTAHTLQGEEQRCLDAGCSAYESKPIDWGTLASKIRSLADDHAARRARDLAA